MRRNLIVLLLFAAGLGAYEDISFSARTLGLGGDQAAVANDAFSAVSNPALPGYADRAGLGLSFEATYPFFAFSYNQPIPGLGTVGGHIFYRDCVTPEGQDRLETDTRFFLSIPVGRLFSFGASLGASGVDLNQYDSTDSYDRFIPGPSAGLGGAIHLPLGLTAGLAVGEWWIDKPLLLNGGLSWTTDIQRVQFISSTMLASSFTFRDGVLKLHAGAEAYILNDIVGLRAGVRYGSDSLSGFSPTLGATIRTHRVEKTDLELHYGLLMNHQGYGDSGLFHQLSLNILFGDARKLEKDSIMAAQKERARKLREEALARERDKLQEELDEIKQERSALEEERKDIQRLRSEAMADLGKVRGVRIDEDSVRILITLTENALRFADDSADIPFPQGYRTLDRLAGFLFHYPNNRIVIEAHVNAPPPEDDEEKEEVETEEPEENPPEKEPPAFADAKSLTSARARIIERYLVEVKGMKESKLSAKGAGDSNPLAEREPHDQANRRIEISIYK